LGFGSIKLKPTITLSNRKQRYSNLLSEWSGFNNTITDLSQTEIDEIITCFERFILSAIGSSSSSLWQEKRLIELRTMLDFNNQVEGEKAKYMLIRNSEGINEYKSRPILKSPTDYIKNS
jgi:hypothetical protein